MAPRLPRAAAALLTAGLVVVPLAGCSGSSGSDGAGSSASAAPSSSAGAGAGGTQSAGPVDCSGLHCSATLSADAATARVLGVQVSLGGVQDGRATLGVAGQTVSCQQGDSVSAGPLRLTCTTVTAQQVTLTAGLSG